MLIITQYVGTVAFGNGNHQTIYIGLSLEWWNPDGHDGTIKDESYFKADDGYGYFVKFEDLAENMGPLSIPHYVFYAQSGDEVTKTCTFEELWQFQISCKSLFERMDVPHSVDIYAKYDDDSMDFVRIASLMKKRYVFERDTPLHITESIVISQNDRVRGQRDIRIKSTSDILIDSAVRIDGDIGSNDDIRSVLDLKASLLTEFQINRWNVDGFCESKRSFPRELVSG